MCFDDITRLRMLYYDIPIVVPFVMFLYDRAQKWRQTCHLQKMLDLFVLVLSLSRAITRFPPISGHALFLIYVLFTTHSRTTQATALAVFLQVAHLKLFVLSDLTLISGTTAGSVTAFGYNKLPPCFERDTMTSETRHKLSK
jgi:hypothetical protein